MADARIEVMRRYVEDYTNGHDLDVAREIMHPDYRFTMGGTALDLETYLAMVEDALGRFTDLRLVVDEFVLGPQRLAMAFRETATSPRHQRAATWHGIALYEFHADGRLLTAEVEQDFWGRREQFRGITPGKEAGTTDPVVWEAAAHPSSLDRKQDLHDALTGLGAMDVTFDDGSPLIVAPTRIDIGITAMSGPRFAARLKVGGGYRPGPGGPDLSITADNPIELGMAGIGTIDPTGIIRDGRFITDRYGTWLKHRPAREEG